MVNPKDQRIKIHQDPDWVNLKRYGNSLETLLVKFSDGVPDKIICNALMIDESTLQDIWETIVNKLKHILKVKG